MDEAAIRDLVAADLSKIDPSLIVVEIEHQIVLEDGSIARIDILAKDPFGCFSVIEIKKSDQTARSAIQQLYKYANFLKRQYRLRGDQIRCIAASTHWHELQAPFSEFAHFSEYDSVGVKLSLIAGPSYNAEIVEVPFEAGGAEAVRNFVFFEFGDTDDRDRAFDDFLRILSTSAASLNSVVIKLDASAQSLPNPFGFSWTIFRSDANAVESDLERWREKPDLREAEFFVVSDAGALRVESVETALRATILIKAPIVPVNRGEINGWAIHSLNNILATWHARGVHLHGRMFASGIFSEDDAVNLCCGFLGEHPYNFVAHISPLRAANFNHARSRLNTFLNSNKRWQRGTSIILDSVEGDAAVIVRIYNPLNFFGMITDLFNSDVTERIPKMDLQENRRNAAAIRYFGTVIWNGAVSTSSIWEAMALAYPEPSTSYALLRSVNQWINEFDEILFGHYGITHELFRVSDEGLDWLNLDVEPARWELSNKDLQSLNEFNRLHDQLIEEAGRWFSQHTANAIPR